MLVGRSGDLETTDEDIRDRMVKLSRQGKHVVRLKSGDVISCEDTQDDLQRLGDAGIPVSLVPGISAAPQHVLDVQGHSGAVTLRDRLKELNLRGPGCPGA